MSWTVSTPPPSTAAGSTVTTSIYETHNGVIALSWYRTALGLSLRANLRLPFPASFRLSSPSSSIASNNYTNFHFRLRPWLLWKRWGTKRFHFNKDSPIHRRTVDFAWDLSRAVFPSIGGPEPTSGFFLAIAVDGEMFLIVGDTKKHNEAYKKTKSKRPVSVSNLKGSPEKPVLLSRREFVNLSGSGAGRLYRTRAQMGTSDNEKEREISIDLVGGKGDSSLCISIEGKIVLNVKRLEWKFRGNERVEMSGGNLTVHISWDVHNWLFSSSSRSTETDNNHGSSDGCADQEFVEAVVVFRVGEDKGGEREAYSGNKIGNFTSELGYFCNSDVGNGGRRKKGKMRSWSSSMSASASTGSSSNNSSSMVMDWASKEENELKESQGFSLLVYFSSG